MHDNNFIVTLCLKGSFVVFHMGIETSYDHIVHKQQTHPKLELKLENKKN